MEIFTVVCFVLLLLMAGMNFCLLLFVAWRRLDRHREERIEKRLEEANEKETERLMDEGFQNIMMYGGSMAEFMHRKDE